MRPWNILGLFIMEFKMGSEYRQEWEYSLMIVDIPRPSETAYGSETMSKLGSTMVEMGNEGWELVTVMPAQANSYTNRALFCFKRPKI